VSIFRLIATASFRLATTYLAIFTASVIVLGAVVYFLASAANSRSKAMRGWWRKPRRYATSFTSMASNGSQKSYARAAGGAAALDYRLADGDGRVLAGDLPGARGPT